MEVRVSYSKNQLEAAAKFVSENNGAYKGRLKLIRESIRKSIWEMAEKFPHLRSLSTMGYIVIGSADEVEGIDHDSNLLTIEIMVDPALSQEENYTEFVYSVSRKGE